MFYNLIENQGKI